MTRALLLALLLSFAAACANDDDPAVDAPTTTTTTSTSTTTTAPPYETVTCASVPFTPNSEDMASEVTATGLSCADAEAFVREAGARTSSGGPDEVVVDGYRCVRTGSAEDPLPRSFYECTDGDRTVTFTRS